MPKTDPAIAPILTADLSDSLITLLRTVRASPCHTLQHSTEQLANLLGALRGNGQPAPLANDPRFQHPAWQKPLQQRLLQAWHKCARQNQLWLAELDLPEHDRARLSLLLSQLEHALAPSNSPLNPLILERIQHTAGRNLLRGATTLLTDLLAGRAIPPLNDPDAFIVGRDLATSAGSVVLRQPMFELIHYQPVTAQVHATPLLIIPPPLNRYYLLDLTPESSLVQHALTQGLQVFLISWRNPNPSHCDWGFEHYVKSAEHALRAAQSICSNTQINLLGVCAGGLLGLLLQGWLQGRDGASPITAASYLVTPLDARLDSDMLRLAGPQARQRLRQKVWRQGYLSERLLGAGFAWLRPQQLVWPQAVQRYALGEEAPADPLMFWSQDTTRMPAQLVEDLLDLAERDPLHAPGWLKIAGVDIDLSRLQAPSWHLGALRDHIVPWSNSFPSARLGGEKWFVQSHSGHVQSLVTAIGQPNAWYKSAPVEQDNSQTWSHNACRHEGSWWPAWSQWQRSRSGPLQPAPTHLGNQQYSPQYAAPGRYVNQS